MNDLDQPPLLDRLVTASPCTASWDDMTGSERVRNCSDCSRQVFNISDMTHTEAEAFLRENGTSQCLLYYRRKDGTIITDDCPIGLRKIRNSIRKLRTIAATLMGYIISTVGVFAQTSSCPLSADSSKQIPINKQLWCKPHKTMLHQLGTPDLGAYAATNFEIPSYSELRSGKYALGNELVEREGRLFVVLNHENGAPGSNNNNNNNEYEPVPTFLTYRNSELTPKILEAAKHYDAAEAFHKICIKTLEKDQKDAASYRQQTASDYRDFLLRQKRVEDARQVEKDFSLAPETETQVVSDEELKKVRINLPFGR